jgi:hypothetical protein
MNENNLSLGGGIVFWTLSEYTARSHLQAGLEAAGFGQFTPEPRPAAGALKDALEHVLGGPNTLIRPLKSRDGFTVVTEERGESGNCYANSLVTRIDPDTLDITFTPFDQRAQPVVDAFNEHLGLLRPAQVSAALVAILDSLGGTRLRPSGAIYWLPLYQLDDWQRVAQAVENAGVGRPHCVYLLRHQMDADAIRAVRDAIVAEVSTEAARLDREVAAGDLGERGLENRKVQAEELRRKIQQYEDILGCGLDSLHAAVDQAEQAACKAALLAAVAMPQEVANAG